MRLKLLWTLWLSLILSLVYSQPDKDKDDGCEKFKEQNRILAQQKMDVANNRDSFSLALEALKLNYRDLQRQHGCCKNNNSKEIIFRDTNEAVNKLNAEKLVIVTKERDSLKKLIERVSKLDNTGNGSKTGKRDLDVVFLEMTIKVKDLEAELGDYISEHDNKIYFMGNERTLGKEILFIPFNGEKPDDKIELTDSQAYSLGRLMKLISKNDHMRIKLEGEWSENEHEKIRKQVARERAKKLHSYLKFNYPLKDFIYDKIGVKKDCEYRKGISILIHTS